MSAADEIRLQKGLAAYGMRREPPKAVIGAGASELKPALMKVEAKPELALNGGAAGDCVPFYVFLREKAANMGPEEKRELWASLLRMAEERKINVNQLIRAIRIGDCEYREILEKI